ILSAENKKMLLIPKGFGHGFSVLSDFAEFSYKVDDFYHPEDEGGIIWNDPDINIAWPTTDGVILSEKDKRNPLFKDAKPELVVKDNL
ncbi:MAG: dTDP-4-dehydrorhamnose 3,5-epimerase family protein, partial [Clostridia bacterium]|nr:dTDP-4-dehydrorhamnose 3,5-epimerase family protein [Clostridia bacterium]